MGFRFLRLAEHLSVVDHLQPLKGNNLKFAGAFLGTGDMLADMDSFRTTNYFYGVQLGGYLLHRNADRVRAVRRGDRSVLEFHFSH